MKNVEIERKWILKRGPVNHPTFRDLVYLTKSVYVSVYPYLRAQKRTLESSEDQPSECKITLKSGSGLVRGEFETEVSEEFYDAVAAEACRIAPNGSEIVKVVEHYYTEHLGRPHRLDVCYVDSFNGGSDLDGFIYAESEFDTREEAMTYAFPFDECDAVEVTGSQYWAMNNYWARTRYRGRTNTPITQNERGFSHE